MMCANDRVHYGPMIVFICYRIIIIMQSYLNVLHFLNTRQVHSIERVFNIKSILSIIFHAIYGAVCIRFTHFSYDDCKNRSPLSLYHHQIWGMTHSPLFMIRAWNNAMRCMLPIFLWNWRNWLYTALCQKYYSLYVESEVVDIGLSNWIEIFQFCNFTYPGLGKWA